MRRKKGIAIGFIFFILVVLFLGGFAISQLMQGVHRQLEFADAHVRSQYIAESAMNFLFARLLSQSWENRWFKNGPDGTTGIDFGGGSYDYFIKDTPDRPFHADIWVRSNYKNTKRSFFWRVKYRHSVLSGLSQGTPITSTELPQEHFPNATTLDPLTQEIESLVAKRKANRGNAEEIENTVKATNRADTAIANQGAAPTKPVRTDGFSEEDDGDSGPITGAPTGSVPPPPPPPPPPPKTFIPEFKFAQINKIDIFGLGLQGFSGGKYLDSETQIEKKFYEKFEIMKNYKSNEYYHDRDRDWHDHGKHYGWVDKD